MSIIKSILSFLSPASKGKSPIGRTIMPRPLTRIVSVEASKSDAGEFNKDPMRRYWYRKYGHHFNAKKRLKALRCGCANTNA